MRTRRIASILTVTLVLTLLASVSSAFVFFSKTSTPNNPPSPNLTMITADTGTPSSGTYGIQHYGTIATAAPPCDGVNPCIIDNNGNKWTLINPTASGTVGCTTPQSSTLTYSANVYGNGPPPYGIQEVTPGGVTNTFGSGVDALLFYNGVVYQASCFTDPSPGLGVTGNTYYQFTQSTGAFTESPLITGTTQNDPRWGANTPSAPPGNIIISPNAVNVSAIQNGSTVVSQIFNPDQWTIGGTADTSCPAGVGNGAQVVRNGNLTDPATSVTAGALGVLIYKSNLYHFTCFNAWYQLQPDGVTWSQIVGDPRPPPTSPDNTFMVDAATNPFPTDSSTIIATNTQIVDGAQNVWKMVLQTTSPVATLGCPTGTPGSAYTLTKNTFATANDIGTPGEEFMGESVNNAILGLLYLNGNVYQVDCWQFGTGNFTAANAQWLQYNANITPQWNLTQIADPRPTTQAFASVGLQQTTFTQGVTSTTNAVVTLNPMSPPPSGDTYAIQLSGQDAHGTACQNFSADFSISTAGVFTNNSTTPSNTYNGVCIVATQSGVTNSPYTQAVSIIVQTAPTAGSIIADNTSPVIDGSTIVPVTGSILQSGITWKLVLENSSGTNICGPVNPTAYPGPVYFWNNGANGGDGVLGLLDYQGGIYHATCYADSSRGTNYQWYGPWNGTSFPGPISDPRGQWLASIALSTSSFTQGVVGAATASTTMAPPSPAFTGTYSLKTSGHDSTPSQVACANFGSDFSISQAGVFTNSASTPLGNYNVCVTATSQANLINNPYTQAILVAVQTAAAGNRDWQIQPFTNTSPWNLSLSTSAQYTSNNPLASDPSNTLQMGHQFSAEWPTLSVAVGNGSGGAGPGEAASSFFDNGGSCFGGGNGQCGGCGNSNISGSFAPPGCASSQNGYQCYSTTIAGSSPIAPSGNFPGHNLSFYGVNLVNNGPGSAAFATPIIHNTSACTPSGDTDSLGVFIQPHFPSSQTNGWEFETIQTTIDSNNTITGFMGSWINLKDDGTGFWLGRRSSNFPGMAGIIRDQELINCNPNCTPIPHAMVGVVAVGNLNNGSPPQWPALSMDTNDSYGNGSSALRMGWLAALPPSVNCTNIGLSAAGITLCHAFQDYGLYSGDRGSPSGNNIQIGMQQNHSQTGCCQSDLNIIFPLLRLVTNNTANTPGGAAVPTGCTPGGATCTGRRTGLAACFSDGGGGAGC